MGNMQLRGFTFVQIPVWLLACTDVEPEAKVVYGYLVWRQGQNAGCWPSLDKIAADLQISRSSVIRHLKSLEQLHYIQVARRLGRANLYTIHGTPGSTVTVSDSLRGELSLPPTASGEPVSAVPPVSSVTPVPLAAPTGVTADTPPVSPAAPHPCHPCDPNHRQEQETGTRAREGDAQARNFHLNKGPSRPPALQIYSDMTKVYHPPGSEAWLAIAETVEGSPKALEVWRETIRAWIICGNSTRNVQGMLDWFRTGKRDNRQRAPEPVRSAVAESEKLQRKLERWWVEQRARGLA